MTRITLFAAAALVAVFLCEAQAQQMPCGPRVQIIEGIGKKYKEVPNAIGIASQGTLVELFVAPSGTWTMLLTRGDGVSCLMGVGTDWQPLPPSKPGQGT